MDNFFKLKRSKHMKTLHKIKMAAGILAIVLIAASCVEGISYDELGDGGATIVKLVPASPSGFFLSVLEPSDQPQTFTLLDVRREATPADLASRTVVKLTFDTGVLTAYNTANGTNFIPVPQADYTTDPANVSGDIEIVFESGDFVKQMSMTIPNAFNLDPALQYAMGYIMTVSSGNGTISKTSADSLVAQVLPKNLYDGVYTVTAVNPMVDVTSATLTGKYPFEYALITTGANTVDCKEVGHDSYRHPILSGENESYYGSFCPQVEFSADGLGTIVNMTNYYGNPAGNTRGTLLDDGATYSWDPVTKNIRVKYHMTMTSAIPDPPHIRTTFDELWTYKGKRD